MNNEEVWHKYILAQEKILENKSRPIGINTGIPLVLNGNTISVSVDQEIYKKVFKEDIARVFKLENYDFSQNFILQDIGVTEKIPLSSLQELKEEAENNYIEFNEHPVIEGEISSINNARIQLEEVLGALPNDNKFKRDGLLFLTTSEKASCEKVQDIIFDKKAGAVFSVNPTMSYFISSFYKKLVIEYEDNSTIIIQGRLHSSIEKLFLKLFELNPSEHKLYFELPNFKNLENKVNELLNKGVEFPKPNNNVFCFSHYQSLRNFSKTQEDWISNPDHNVGAKINRLKKTLHKYFETSDINFLMTTKYYYNKRKLNDAFTFLPKIHRAFWTKLYSDVHGDTFQISKSKNTLSPFISFDFSDQQELANKIHEIKKISFFSIYDRGESHKYKYKIKFNTGLHELQSKLRDAFPNLNTVLVANGERLLFKQFYKTGNKGFIRDHLNDKLHEFIDESQFNFTINDTFKEKYICQENFDLKVEYEGEKLSKLSGKEFYFGNKNEKYYLGKLQRVDYPNLEFFVDDEKLEEVKANINLSQIKAIFPNLKGERDKIIRLSDTIQKLQSNQKLPNDNAKHFLFDSSKAKPIAEIEYLLNENSKEWSNFIKNIFSGQLNKSQKKAIYKSLYAEDLALIQGPPGTGKSTAIAEIVWQHVLRNQKDRILLTSETNLAVDNAIDKLRNGKQNIVKPIRFGNSEKLQSEGQFYSLDKIDKWKNMSESQEPNAVSHWLNNISNKVRQHDNDIINNFLLKWKSLLKSPNQETRELFSTSYLENVNLIGSTGSSIGKFNSENKYTSFFHSYLNVFEHNNYFPSINRDKCNKTNIIFDTIIMDEASKATPPEIALPILYGKKAIIVGDHRQLPPMVDDEDIKETLIAIGEKDLAKTLSRSEFDKSQFQYLFENIDPSLKGTFDTQYRMHPAINDVVSQFYIKDGGLKCGLPIQEVEHQSFDSLTSRYHGLKFENVISPETHVLWVNVETPEIKEGTSRVNYGEIEAINNILKVIKKSDGIIEFNNWLIPQTDEEKQIAIISFYGRQVNYIDRMLKENHSDISTRLSTVDRFQGMERNIVIVSLVRSNKISSSKDQHPNFDLYEELGYPRQSSLGFAESPNRLNVALSRARRLLIIVGNKEHFCTKEIYKNLFDTISSSKRCNVIDSIELNKH